MTGLRLLFVATKPAYPPSDGGRLLIWNTLQELARSGHRVTYIAPDLGDGPTPAMEGLLPGVRSRLVPGRPRRLAPSLLRSLLSNRPLSVIRHSHPTLRQAIADELARGGYDVVHAEQVQSFCNVPHSASIPPVVLRAQNVESHLWRMVAEIRPRLRWLARFEASKMRTLEERCVRSAAATIALTQRDATALCRGPAAGDDALHVIPPPFPATMPGGGGSLDGAPAVLLLGGGWLPNRDSIQWFFSEIWDAVRSTNPAVHAHVFGGRAVRGCHAVDWRPSPSDSRDLFAAGAVLAVPLRVASGIRMKIIESWSRGTPVVATPDAAAGLGAGDGVDLLLARDGAGFANALLRIHAEPGLRDTLVANGRDRLRRVHDPVRIGEGLESVYRSAIARSRPGGASPAATAGW